MKYEKYYRIVQFGNNSVIFRDTTCGPVWELFGVCEGYN